MLFSVCSHYYIHYRTCHIFRVGSLCLPYSHAISNAWYSGYLQFSTIPSSTGLSPSMASRSRELRVRMARNAKVQTPHLHSITGWIRFALFPVRSPLLRESLLVSFPPPTRMLYFGGFPVITDRLAAGSPIQASVDQRLHAPTHRFSQLGTPFFGGQARPSPRWRSQQQAIHLPTVQSHIPMSGFTDGFLENRLRHLPLEFSSKGAS